MRVPPASKACSSAGVSTRASQLRGRRPGANAADAGAGGQRSTDCVNKRTGMAESILALQAAEMIDGSTFRQAIGIAGGDAQGVEDPESILQIRHLGIHGGRFTPQALHLSQALKSQPRGVTRRSLRLGVIAVASENGPVPSCAAGVLSLLAALVHRAGQPGIHSAGAGCGRCRRAGIGIAQQGIHPGFELGESPVLLPQLLGYAPQLHHALLVAGIPSPIERRQERAPLRQR